MKTGQMQFLIGNAHQEFGHGTFTLCNSCRGVLGQSALNVNAMFLYTESIFCPFSGNALVKTGQTQILIGNAHREFVQSTANNFLQPLKNFLEGDMKTIMVCLLLYHKICDIFKIFVQNIDCGYMLEPPR